jgi:hypothetical protein
VLLLKAAAEKRETMSGGSRRRLRALPALPICEIKTPPWTRHLDMVSLELTAPCVTTGAALELRTAEPAQLEPSARWEAERGARAGCYLATVFTGG